MKRGEPGSRLFPYTTLFRSHRFEARGGEQVQWVSVVIRPGRRRKHRELAELGERKHREIRKRIGRSHAEHAAHLFQLEERRRSEEHTSELQSQSNLVCRLLL